jgi:hypothetical protein
MLSWLPDENGNCLFLARIEDGYLSHEIIGQAAAEWRQANLVGFLSPSQ